MKTNCRVLLILFYIAISLKVISQNRSWPNTLLWKIERSDLSRPSFLFGTMHLQDKRLFNLGDSFYYHFERAEGFAIEIDFKEYTDSVMGRIFSSIEDKELSTDEQITTVDEKIDVNVDSATNITTPAAPVEMKKIKYLKKYFRKIRNERIKRLLIYGEMPTILDAYLYGIAIKQGKWIGAVEDVSDQLNIKDELGKDIDEEDMKQPEDRMLLTLENMIKIYLAQDLNKIEDYSLNYSSPRQKTIIFNNRNGKMVKSIDSLSHNRSMFYAVGAAHLPGDSGVIKLLQEKGYTVTPVYSTTTIAAEKYAQNLPSLSWYQVGQTDSLYTIDMPGIPTEYNMFGDLVKMKVLIDITTMTYYMTGHTISQFDENKLTETLKALASSMGGSPKVENIKKVDRPGLKAVEGIISGRDGYYRVQVLTNNKTSFFVMMGGSKKALIQSADAGKFFNSFKVNTVSSNTPKSWATFELADKGFSVLMPGVPKRNKVFEKQADNTDWNYTVYDYTDMSAGIYYLMQVRDIIAGHFLPGDSIYFSSFSESLGASKIQKFKEDFSMFNGFPAMRLDAIAENENIFYKTKNIIRGNRVYSLAAIGNVSKKDEKGPDDFFDSFHFTEYKTTNTQPYFSPDYTFSTIAPEKFNRVKKEEGADSLQAHYTSYNANEAISYEVIKDVIPELYWAVNDSTFFRDKANAYKNYEDSVLSYRKIKNGKLSGVEQIIQMPSSNNLKKIRLLLHGDTLYTLITYVPTQYIKNTNHLRFFEEFAVKNDNNFTTLFNNKAGQLLNSLQSKDSSTFEKARSYLGSAPFTGKDLPLLHSALLQNYADDTLTYGTVTSSLISIMDGLSDSSTVDFIRSNYDKFPGAKGDGKVALLNILADLKTNYSYTLLKDLLISKTPVQLSVRKSLGYGINDSLELIKTLYPEILNLLINPDFGMDISDYTSTLLDSNQLSNTIIKPFEKNILFMADTLLNGTAIHEEDAWLWSYNSYLNLLAYLNTPASSTLLQKFAESNAMDLKRKAIISLLHNNIGVDKKEIEKLAADKLFRIGLYSDLKKIGKQSLFTPKYLTQKYFAEAEMYNYDFDDYSPSAVEYLGERVVQFGGQQKRIFLYRIAFNYDEEKEQEAYLGVSGPFSMDAKDIETKGEATDIYYEETYDKRKIEKQLKELLKKGEDYLLNN